MVPIEQKGILERSYGIGSPMPMRRQEAPLAAARNGLGHETYVQGMQRISDSPLNINGPISIDTAVRHFFSFLQITGVRKGEQFSKAVNASQGLAWDRQLSMEEVAIRLLSEIGAEDIVGGGRFGYKWVALIETESSSKELYNRFISAPDKAYQSKMPYHLADVQTRIQRIRKGDQITRDWFIENFNFGINDKNLKQAFKKEEKGNNQLLFRWDCLNTGEDLWGIDADGDSSPVSYTSMALDPNTDENTRRMLLMYVDFLKGSSDKNRFIIQFNYGADAVCCDASANAQYEEVIFNKTIQFTKLFHEPAAPLNERREICSKCHQPKKCNCKNV